MFSLQRVSGIVPYFVCAAGLFGIGTQDDHLYMDSATLIIGETGSMVDKMKAERDRPVGTNQTDSVFLPHTPVSLCAHARLLLVKMSLTHPNVIVAASLLQEAADFGR